MAKETKETESILVILEGGDEITITYPVEIAEDLLEEMREAQSKDEFWYVGNYIHARAMYKGFFINHINTKRVIGFS